MCFIPPTARAEAWTRLACAVIYLHPIQLTSASRESWLINTSNVVLAMADIRPAHRIPRRARVRVICIIDVLGCRSTRPVVFVKPFYI